MIVNPPPPEECASAWMRVKAREVASPSWWQELLSLFSSKHQVLDADHWIWTYHSVFGKVLHFQRSAYRQITVDEYRRSFGL